MKIFRRNQGQARVQAGVPAGGQFTATARSEGDVSLSGGARPSVMAERLATREGQKLSALVAKALHLEDTVTGPIMENEIRLLVEYVRQHRHDQMALTSTERNVLYLADEIRFR